MPRVSIVLPTYNRADILPRALGSIAAQRYKDWELIIVDDGSTDETESVVRNSEVPHKYIQVENGGVSAARNIGIQSSEGTYVAFLDSDDEWDPGYLSVCADFLDKNPEEQIVATELLQDFGGGRQTSHPYLRVKEWYPELAATIGSHALDLSANETDPYMRFFTNRVNVTDWVASRIGETPAKDVFHYHGNVFSKFRWGYLFSVTSVVVRKSVIDQIGMFNESLTSGEDFLFIAEICRKYDANFISWPGLIKHEFNSLGRTTQEGHLATSGRRLIQFYINLLRAFDQLYGPEISNDQELRRLKGYWYYMIGKEAMNLGNARLAEEYLSESLSYFPEFEDAQKKLRIANRLYGPLGKLYSPASKGISFLKRIIDGSLDITGYFRRVFKSS